MPVTICQRCGDAVFESAGLTLVTIAPPDGRRPQRQVVCRDCAERLIVYLAARPAGMATADLAE